LQLSEGRFRGSGGLELCARSWEPATPPAAAVVLVHGVGEHCGRYGNLVDPLAENGYAVYSYDQRGHGVSPGARVHIDRWAQYRDDLEAYLAVVRERVGDVPVVLYGHSMGSLVVLDYVIERPDGLGGAIVSGVALRPVGVASPALIALARVMSRVVPRFGVDLGIPPTSLSRDPKAIEASVADPYLTSRATARWGTESLAAVERVKRRMGEIELPVLVLHGEADPLNDAEGARELFDAVASSDKTLRIYPDVLHEPHNDLGYEQVAADVAEWLAQHSER
jgi:alpha-beta hydrolase superfamily lysophospholipase